MAGKDWIAGFMWRRFRRLRLASSSIGKRLARFYDPNLVIGEGHVSVGELDLRHMTTHAFGFGRGTDLRVGLRDRGHA